MHARIQFIAIPRQPVPITAAPMTCDAGPYYEVRRITLKGWREGEAPIGREFSRSEWKFLVGLLDRRAEVFATVCVWDVHASEWALPPEYLAEYRCCTTSIGDRRHLLAVAYTYTPDIDTRIGAESEEFEVFEEEVAQLSERGEIEFAWRLERHWLVEWLDLPRGQRRPPVIFLGTGFTTVLLGCDLPARLRLAAATLVAFPLLTADEIRSTFRFLGEPAPTASDLSRVLSYFEDIGLLVSATPAAADAYWKLRNVGRRPLRLFASVLCDAHRWRPGRWRLVGHDSPLGLSKFNPRPCALQSNGAPDDDTAFALDRWKSYVVKLRQRGLRTV